MNLFGLTITKSSPVPVRTGPWFGFVRESFAGAWQKNVVCDNRESILAFSAVYACINRISTDIAKLRIRLVSLIDGIWIEELENSPFWPALRKPNAYQNRIQFTVAWIVSKLLYGNAYILKERDLRGIVTAMHVLDPRRVMPLVTEEGSVYYQLGNDPLSGVGTTNVTVPAREIIHDRGVTLFHPLVGVSPIYACGSAATQGNRIQANSAQFFENMSRPSGMLTAPDVIDDVTAMRIKQYWEDNFTGTKVGRLAVLGDGLKYEAMTINAVDAQLIEQLRWTVEDVARAFSVPLYKINSGPMPTNNNVAALELQYYSGCLQVLIESMELCLDEGLSLPAGRGTEFDLDGLLRMDAATMFDALGKAVGAGLMAPNEGRAKMNLAKVKGGDTPYLQQQNYSLAALDKRDSLEDPFGKAAAPALPVPAVVPALPAPEPAKGIDEERFAIWSTALMAAQAKTSEMIERLTDRADAGQREKESNELVEKFADELIGRFENEALTV